MDAISFVLGIKSSHLRSTNLRDLVYRGRVLRTSKINDYGSASKDNVDGEPGEGLGDASQEPAERNDPKTAWVMAVYEDDAGEEQQWRRSITSQGVSEYRINNRDVTIKQYQEQKREAENYSRKADGRDQAIITHILWKLFHFQRLIEESSAEIQKHQDELKEHRRGVERYERSLEEAKKEHARVGRDVAKVEKSIKTKEKEIEDATNSLVPVDEKLEISRKKVERYASRISEIAKESDSQSKGVRQLEKDLKVVGKAQSQWENEWKKTASKKGIQLSDADLQEYNKLKEEVNKRSSTDQLKLDNLKRQRKTEAETVNSLKSNFESTEWQAKRLQSDMNNMLERENSIMEAVERTCEEIDRKK